MVVLLIGHWSLSDWRAWPEGGSDGRSHGWRALMFEQRGAPFSASSFLGPGPGAGERESERKTLFTLSISLISLNP